MILSDKIHSIADVKKYHIFWQAYNYKKKTIKSNKNLLINFKSHQQEYSNLTKSREFSIIAHTIVKSIYTILYVIQIFNWTISV